MQRRKVLNLRVQAGQGSGAGYSHEFMSRVKRFAASMATGYLAMAVNIAYTLLSIPLALYYLGKEEFGLWVLALQLSGYLGLIELGMGGAVARILGDYKDHRDGGEYGSVLKTAIYVTSLQGVLVLLAGLCLSPLLVFLMDVPSSLKNEFMGLLWGQSLFIGITIALKPLGAPLWCHQRQDVTNYASMATFSATILTVWAGFMSGLGIWSMLLGGAVSLLLGHSIILLSVWKIGLLPVRGAWGKANKKHFYELFSYGRDVFLVSLGTQLVGASQIVIISRMISLEMAAVWSIGTKFFVLAQQAVFRLMDYSSPTLTEMYVRGELIRFEKRFRDIVAISAAAAALVGIVGTGINSEFVKIWTDGKIEWSYSYDVLLAFLLLTTTITRCHTALPGLTKDIRNTRYIYLVEGVIFLGLVFFLVKNTGIIGVLLSSLLANIVCSGAYGVYRSSLLFRKDMFDVGIIWIKKPLYYYLVFMILMTGLMVFMRKPHGVSGLVLLGGTSIILGAILFWLLALQNEVRREIWSRIRVAATRIGKSIT